MEKLVTPPFTISFGTVIKAYAPVIRKLPKMIFRQRAML